MFFKQKGLEIRFGPAEHIEVRIFTYALDGCMVGELPHTPWFVGLRTGYVIVRHPERIAVKFGIVQMTAAEFGRCVYYGFGAVV